ncbi:MAG: class I SAM-dependent methyltransferase, partial [Gammaproteobacteria bacterium]|nr:class I SAM-dependent methyltransferase [Gammaproteobacteria bacterium]
MAEYDAIARGYQESKRLPFREHIERHTLFQLLGDVAGKTVLDLACGDGFYTRLLRQAGASQVTGVDISRAMIELAE